MNDAGISGSLQTGSPIVAAGCWPRSTTAKPSGSATAMPGLRHRFVAGEDLGFCQQKSPYRPSLMATTLTISMLPMPLTRLKKDERTW